MVFYFFSVLMALNILMAFTIDMYASVERLDEERERTIGMIKQEIEEEDEECGRLSDGDDLSEIEERDRLFEEQIGMKEAQKVSQSIDFGNDGKVL